MQWRVESNWAPSLYWVLWDCITDHFLFSATSVPIQRLQPLADQQQDPLASFCLATAVAGVTTAFTLSYIFF